MDALKDQGSLYSEYSNEEQTKFGKDLITPYLKSGFHVLDIGCGTGNLSLYALDIVGSDGSLVGVDPDKDRIQLAKKTAKDRPNATFMCCKGSDTPLTKKGTFDVSFSNAVFHWMEENEKKATLDIVFQLLKPGGMFLIQYIDPIAPIPVRLASFLGEEYPKKLEDHWYMKNINDFTMMCKDSRFEILHSESFEYEVIWKNLGGLLTFLTAAVGGLIDFRKVEDKLTNEGKEVPSSWIKNGAFYNIIQLQKLIIQKPQQ